VSDEPVRIREVLLFLVIAMSVTAMVGQAFTSDVPVDGEVRFQAESGMEVFLDPGDTPATVKGGGTIFQSDTRVRVNTASAGAVEFNSSAAVEARVDTLASGGFTNVSQLDVAPGNLTLDPDGGDATTISGDLCRCQRTLPPCKALAC